MSSILTNTSSMVALETLRNINRNLETVQSEISTGKKVSTAKDNASIWAISTVMSTDVESFKQITDTLNKGSSVVGVARTASEQITGLLQDMKELIVSAQEDLNADDRAKIQTDIDALSSSISNIVNAAQFNGQNLLKGTDSINVLASLDRSSDGTVSATNITVSRNDLQTSGAVDEADKVDGDAGFAETSDSATVTDVDKSSGDGGFITLTGVTSNATASGGAATFTFTAGAIAAGDEFTINVGGTDFSYTAADGDTINDVITDLAAQVTTADGTSAISNYDDVTINLAADPLVNDASLVFAADSGNTLTVTEASTAATYEQSQIDE
ncbi:MAG: flagellin, partial [Henriciella sp.]